MVEQGQLAAYVGRLGRHILQQLDLAMATDLVDPKSGMGYFTTATLMSQFALAHGQVTGAVIPPIPYFENLFTTAGGQAAEHSGACKHYIRRSGEY